MIGDLPSLNFLTAPRNAIHHRVLAIGHVILQFLQLSLPFAAQLVVIAINIQ